MTRARDLASGLAGVRPFAMASGITGTLTLSTAGAVGGFYAQTTVTLPAGRFTQTPVLSTGNESQFYIENLIAFVSGVTSSSFTAWGWSSRTGATTKVQWMAIQMTSGAASG
jgi:hypothetical protein